MCPPAPSAIILPGKKRERQRLLRCPRCNTPIIGLGAQQTWRYCQECGLPLHDVAPIQRSVSAQSRAQEGPGAPRGQAADPEDARSNLAGYSVLAVVGAARPASGSFWIGLVLLAFGLLCAPLIAGLGLISAESPEVADPGGLRATWTIYSCCTFVALLVPAAIFIMIGRPRRLS